MVASFIKMEKTRGGTGVCVNVCVCVLACTLVYIYWVSLKSRALL